MFTFKTIILTLCLVLIDLLVVSSVSAVDNDNDVFNVTDNTPVNIANVVVSNATSFRELQEDINYYDNIRLTHDIHRYGSQNIEIDKKVIIDGAGHTIDGEQCRIFNIKAYGDLTLKNTILINGFYNKDGGAVYNSGTLTIDNSTFNNNIADCNIEVRTYTGGLTGAGTAGFSLDLTDYIFTNNAPYRYGGVIYNNHGTLTITSSTFTNNKAGGYGGAIYNNGGILTIIGSTFTNNKAYEDGGAIYNRAKTLNIVDCVFVNNSVINYDSDYFCIYHQDGGAIYSSSNVNCINSYFIGNHAEDGGTIHCEAILTLKNCTFINNTAKNAIHACEGGAVNCDRLNECSNCTFIGNCADNGGAIAIMEEAKNNGIKDCIFKDNKATALKHGVNGKGGAIFVNRIKAHISLIHNQFIDNTATNKGDNVYNWGHYDTIEYNYFPNPNQNTFREWKFLIPDKCHRDKNPYYNLTDYYNHKNLG